MSNRYNQGDVVRVTCLFSFDVPSSEVFFELTNVATRETTVVEIGVVVSDLQIIIDPLNSKQCYIDIDTFTRPGSWAYFFYSRTADHKAGAKNTFLVA